MSAFSTGDWVVTYLDKTEGVTFGKPYEVTAVDNGMIRFWDDDKDLRRRNSIRYQAYKPPLSDDEYNEIMEGEEIWASIRTNSGN